MAKNSNISERTDETTLPTPPENRSRTASPTRGRSRTPDEGNARPRPARSKPKRTGRSLPVVEEVLDVDASTDRPPAPATSPRAKTPLPRKTAGLAAGANSDLTPAPEETQATRVAQLSELRSATTIPPVGEATCAGPAISIEVVRGPDRGVRVPVRGRLVVGREADCDLKLSDNTVSRRHLELASGPAGLVLRDLGSINGCTVNGTRQAELVVKHNDEIALGATVLKVVDELKRLEEEPDKAAAPAEESEPEPPLPKKEETGIIELPQLPPAPHRQGPDRGLRKLPLAMKVMIAVAAVLLLLVIGKWISAKPQNRVVEEQNRKQAALLEKSKIAEQEAQNLLRSRKYEEALERYRQAKEMVKERELAGDRFVDTCQRNIEANKQLEEARAAAAESNWDKAIEKAEAVDDSTDAGSDAKELVKKWKEQKLQQAIDKVRKAAEGGDFEGAKTLLGPLPPDQQELLKSELKEKEKDWKANEARHKAEVANTARKVADIAKAKLRDEINEGIAPIVRKMEKGDFEGALRQCDHVIENSKSKAVSDKARVLQKTIPAFGQAYNDGMNSYRDTAYDQAANSLLRALKLLGQMDIDYPNKKALADKAARALAIKGSDAAARQDYSAAARAFKAAREINPDLREIRDGQAALRRAANDVFEEGYMLKDRDASSALRHFQTVLDIVPEGDPLAEKAKKWRDELNQR